MKAKEQIERRLKKLKANEENYLIEKKTILNNMDFVPQKLSVKIRNVNLQILELKWVLNN